MPETLTPYPWETQTATDLWNALVGAVGRSEYLDEALTSLAVRVGILVECGCGRAVDSRDPANPCDNCGDGDA